MKKLLIIFFTVVFFILPLTASAQEMNQDSPKPSPSPSPAINYTLPYPGILPGSPIYPVKVLRDRIVEFFISDPLKRADFYVLEGDKHIAAAQILIARDNKNYKLAESTISKGENYMQLSLDQIPTVKDLQLEDNELLDKLVKALEKHNAVIKNLEKNAPADVKPGLKNSLMRAQGMQKKAEQLKLQEESKK